MGVYGSFENLINTGVVRVMYRVLIMMEMACASTCYNSQGLW